MEKKVNAKINYAIPWNHPFKMNGTHVRAYAAHSLAQAHTHTHTSRQRQRRWWRWDNTTCVKIPNDSRTLWQKSTVIIYRHFAAGDTFHRITFEIRFRFFCFVCISRWIDVDTINENSFNHKQTIYFQYFVIFFTFFSLHSFYFFFKATKRWNSKSDWMHCYTKEIDKVNCLINEMNVFVFDCVSVRVDVFVSNGIEMTNKFKMIISRECISRICSHRW